MRGIYPPPASEPLKRADTGQGLTPSAPWTFLDRMSASQGIRWRW